MEHYSYVPIQPDELRVCRFVDDGEHLSAELRTFPASASPPYNALSYTWALADEGPLLDWDLRIGERQLPALASLRPFVEALRSGGSLLEGTWWWIDSICVDQSNLSERSAHVQRMDHIYWDAHEVVVWLGEQTDDSADAPDFINLLVMMNASPRTKENLRTTLRQDIYVDKWKALRQFFLRKWWTRVWTIQEFTIPERVTFWYGARQLQRTAIFKALSVARLCNVRVFKDSTAFYNAWNRRRAFMLNEHARRTGKDMKLSLVALAAYFCHNDATDDRDRLYGLTSLSANNHGLVIDYSLSVNEVYIRFARSFITEHKSLDIISFASIFAATPGSSLPSWVPDWRTKTEPLVVPLMASQTASSIVGNLRHRYENYFKDDCEMVRYEASGLRRAACTFDGIMLKARGCVIDTLLTLTGADSEVRTEIAGHQLISSEAVLMSLCKSLVLARGDRYLQHLIPEDKFYRDFIRLLLLLTTDPSQSPSPDITAWFASARHLDIHGRTIESWLQQLHDEDISAIMEMPGARQDANLQDSFYGRFYDTVKSMSMRLMTTLGGRIGMASQRATRGDIICIIYGCSVPMLLRKKEEEDVYIVIGECYVDGCMQGEVLQDGQYAEKEFRIV